MPRITVSGLPGSGTSTLANRLAGRLRIPVISTGRVFRRLAEDRGLSLEEFGRLADRDPAIDRSLDATMLELMAETGAWIAEGRLTGTLAPAADIRILLHAPLAVRAGRVLARSGETQEQMLVREMHEQARYRSIYGIDPEEASRYDLAIDTGAFNRTAVVDLVLQALAARPRGRG